MELTTEIQRIFASSSNESITPISNLPDSCKAWVIRTNREYGVGIPASNDLQVSERFAGARLWTNQYNIMGIPTNLLILSSDKEYLRMEFSVICSQFVDPGENGSNRILLQNDPLVWWERWRSLLGNKYHEKPVHGMLGELMTYLLLLKKGESPYWSGANGSSIDFVTDTCDYEVKSTISRYENTIRISGQFQLERNSDKPLALVLFRFEPSIDGYCINEVVRELVDSGVDRHGLEARLFDQGFEDGASSRNRRFWLHEIRHYKVDNNFPGITLKSFKDEKLPDRVKHLAYSIDLTGIPYDVWNL